MSEYANYRYSLALTSQFYFCSLPLRLDSYDTCLFSCQYCFAAARGGHRGNKGLKTANSHALRNALIRSRTKPNSAVVELLANRQPIHFGGMSDPFPELERKLGVSLGLLKVLAEDAYPTIISTKGTLVAESPYLDVLKRGDFVVQFSFSTKDSRLAQEVDYGAPPPTQRLEALSTLIQEGVPTAVRLQPLIPGHEAEAHEFLEELAELGVVHVGVEHLKLPLEGWTGSTRLGKALATNLRQHYIEAGATREGREWVLPVAERLPVILELRDRTHKLGLSFGAADSDLLPMSDGSWCCSGADSLLRGGSGFEFNYLGAVRRVGVDGLMTYGALDDCWAPAKSIAMMVNSHSRLPTTEGAGVGVRDYIRANWNGRANGCSPAMFYGVEPTDHRDSEGLIAYTLSAELRELLSHRASRHVPARDETSAPTGRSRVRTLPNEAR